ncbi:MAG: hypothetical protein KC561_13780, partial [Myxococcales bacterium]|nr:hypothetical protein [Myxococcales bacterium]
MSAKTLWSIALLLFLPKLTYASVEALLYAGEEGHVAVVACQIDGREADVAQCTEAIPAGAIARSLESGHLTLGPKSEAECQPGTGSVPWFDAEVSAGQLFAYASSGDPSLEAIASRESTVDEADAILAELGEDYLMALLDQDVFEVYDITLRAGAVPQRIAIAAGAVVALSGSYAENLELSSVLNPGVVVWRSQTTAHAVVYDSAPSTPYVNIVRFEVNLIGENGLADISGNRCTVHRDSELESAIQIEMER